MALAVSVFGAAGCDVFLPFRALACQLDDETGLPSGYNPYELEPADPFEQDPDDPCLRRLKNFGDIEDKEPDLQL